MEITTARSVTERWEWPAGILHFAAQQAGTCQGMQGRQRERVGARCSEQTVKCQRWYGEMWDKSVCTLKSDVVRDAFSHSKLNSGLDSFSSTRHNYCIIIRSVVLFCFFFSWPHRTAAPVCEHFDPVICQRNKKNILLVEPVLLTYSRSICVSWQIKSLSWGISDIRTPYLNLFHF